MTRAQIAALIAEAERLIAANKQAQAALKTAYGIPDPTTQK